MPTYHLSFIHICHPTWIFIHPLKPIEDLLFHEACLFRPALDTVTDCYLSLISTFHILPLIHLNLATIFLEQRLDYYYNQL